uniref:Thyroglobulin type-1 domain-containing protein n=1 Tax=Cynoglossus semilaevis TaxID=244447 RepID=A0A3P8UJ13_CYNSE
MAVLDLILMFCFVFQVLTPLLHYCTAEEQKYSEAVVVPSCTSSGAFQEVQCHSGECWCVDSRGQEVTGSRTSGQRPRCPSRCEKEQAAALRVRGSLAAGCDSDGLFIPLQCDETSCWCVSVDGQEVGGTRTPQETQLKPSCDRKNMCVSVFLCKVKEHF